MTSTAPGKAELLTLSEIAAWQVAYPPARQGEIVAALPALQRGAVWKVKQIEELWDSILRRFPIGAFIIAPPNDALKQQNFKLQADQSNLPLPTHLLLDGQQRATGIALGFYDIWRNQITDAKSTLWLDLANPPESREVDFVLRVLTRAHPWGYKRTDPDSPLSAHQIRMALQAFQSVNQLPNARPEDFQLQQTWPWDAEAPVPFPLLVNAVSQQADLQAARADAWQAIQKLPMFNKNATFQKGNEEQRSSASAYQALEKQQLTIRQAFEDASSPQYRRLMVVLQRLHELLSGDTAFHIPALPLDLQEAGYLDDSAEETVPHPSSTEDAAKKDAIELLFIRVNSAGTPLEGEELTYSLLKAAWPDAAKFIDGLDHKPAQASRIATLCSRLILARRQLVVKDKKLTMPATPGVNEFRRLVRNQNPLHLDFFADLQKFIEIDANSLFTAAWQFLTEKPYALLPVLAVELAQKSPDVYFLLLRWIDRLQAAGIKIDQLDKNTHRRTLGFLTSLAWFAQDKAKACAAIWPDIQVEVESKQLVDRFNRTRFKQACRLDTRFNMCMIPLPTVEQLELACSRGVTGHPGCANTISKANSKIWSDWDWYTSFADLLVKDKDIKDIWSELLQPSNTHDGEIPDLAESSLQSVRHFADVLWDSRQILLYAQRTWLKKWYPRFDPSLPEYMEDKNRPWDYDHILPQNLLRTDSGSSRRNIPNVLWDWCGSIGNLRAWPLEANRSDSDISPTLKLGNPSLEECRYGIKDGPNGRAASFVQENIDWPHWQKCVPMADNGEDVIDRRYLASSSFHDYRQALIKAIVLRFVALYREWYDEMRIADLH